MIRECQTWEDYRQIVESSANRPVFLLKHSTRCPISSAAWRTVQQYDRAHPDIEVWRVLVIENRDLSSRIAHEADVRHQSPQLLLFHRGKVVWHDSHWSITEEAIESALDRASD